MKYLADRFKLLIGTQITDKKRDEDFGNIIIRHGRIEAITDSLIVVRFINPNGTSPDIIECFNKGDVISRGVVINNDTKMVTYVCDALF